MTGVSTELWQKEKKKKKRNEVESAKRVRKKKKSFLLRPLYLSLLVSLLLLLRLLLCLLLPFPLAVTNKQTNLSILLPLLLSLLLTFLPLLPQLQPGTTRELRSRVFLPLPLLFSLLLLLLFRLRRARARRSSSTVRTNAAALVRPAAQDTKHLGLPHEADQRRLLWSRFSRPPPHLCRFYSHETQAQEMSLLLHCHESR